MTPQRRATDALAHDIAETIDTAVAARVDAATEEAVRPLRLIVTILGVTTVLLAAAAIVLTVIFSGQRGGDRELAARVLKTQRAADFNACSRGNRTRAELQLGLAAKRPQREKRLPILDCAPLLAGGNPVGISLDQQRLFVHVYERTGRSPLIRRRRVDQTLR